MLRTKSTDGVLSSASTLSSADNEYSGDGREINTADKNYQADKSNTSGGNSGGASSGGGSAPSGC